MSVLGWGRFGEAGLGPSRAFSALPNKNWRDWEITGQAWIEEFIDACGNELDLRYVRFGSPTARANMLDPTHTPTETQDPYLATSTAAPTLSGVQDTMLDVLLYIALGIYPVDSNLSVAKKQALAAIGWTALARKGTRRQCLNLASKIADSVVYGWTTPPSNFSLIIPDGEPSPGYGSWVQPLSSSAESARPWIFAATRNTLSPSMFPAWCQLGIGFSQFRASYSSAGEPIFPVGARLNALANEHFSNWTTGTPDNWTKSGSATLTQSSSASSINWEFSGYAAVLDLTAATIGQSMSLSQSATVNNQITHRLQLDYSYSNLQNVSALNLQITDVNGDGNTYYWNPTSSVWTTSAYTISVPPSASRGRYACNVVPQAASNTATTQGTKAVTVTVSATSDGTATTQQLFTIYRVGLYEAFDVAIDQASFGERTLWLPLIDAQGWSTATRPSPGVSVIEPASGNRSSYKVLSASSATFPYHGAVSGRGFLATSAWTNLLIRSNTFTDASWVAVNSTVLASQVVSPVVGETVASAPTVTITSGTGGSLTQTTGIADPSSKSYVGGLWVNKQSIDANFTDVTLSLISNGKTTYSTVYTLTQAQGWQLLPVKATFAAGDTGALKFQVSWGAASGSGVVSLASAYLYDVTGKTGVLYPPVCQTGATTSTVGATSCLATTSGADVLHPLLKRTLASVVRGSMGLSVVPTFDATSQPNGVIFDLAQGAAQNRVALRIAAGAIELRRWDNAGNQWVATLTLSANPSPSSGSVTWLRDTAISIRCLWDENSTQLSVGASNSQGTKPGSWNPLDASVSKIAVGCDYAQANPFDGIVRAGEVDQLGAVTT